MLVEMGSMLSLNSGVKVYDALKENDKVIYIFIIFIFHIWIKPDRSH